MLVSILHNFIFCTLYHYQLINNNKKSSIINKKNLIKITAQYIYSKDWKRKKKKKTEKGKEKRNEKTEDANRDSAKRDGETNCGWRNQDGSLI